MRPDLKARVAGRRVVASVSGGKDSAALSLWLTEQEIEHDRVFLDTGWESKLTYEYLRGELSRVLGPIMEVAAPTNMADLVLARHTFPSRVRKFCTQELKVFPMRDHLATMLDSGVEPINAVGVRAAESKARARLEEWEWSDTFDCDVWRPLIRWTEDEVIAIHKRHGLAPNPLYLLGARRVGCWPCIHSAKGELRLLASTDRERVSLIAELEKKVGQTMFTRDRRTEKKKLGDDGPSVVPAKIEDIVAWALDPNGRPGKYGADEGQLFDAGCMRWGLCETSQGGEHRPAEREGSR